MVSIADVMRHVNNFFEVGTRTGKFSVEGGSINLPDLLPGQYFWIYGSIFNDGLHDSTDGLVDEVFNGDVVYMAVPRDFLNLCVEIQMWDQIYGDVSASPYKSESFGGYQYTKDGNDGGMAWYDIPSVKNRLNAWRKL